MKNFLIFVLAVGAALVWYHDKAQTEQLAQLQAQNDSLTAQLTQTQAALAVMRNRLASAAAAVPPANAWTQARGASAPAQFNGFPDSGSTGGLQMGHLQGSALDQPAHR